MEKAKVTTTTNNKTTFNFVIVGKLINNQSQEDAFEYIEYLLKNDSRFTDINVIHIFGED
ncbi:MAG: hypothetical protein ACR2F1_00390 [Nitrososphaeraceae archaeon]